MNILFFLTQKDNVKCIYDDYTMRQAIEKMDIYGYSAIPILNRQGEYVATLSEGDILYYIKNNTDLSLKDAEDVMLKDIPIKRVVNPIKIDSDIEDLLIMSLNQNFVPVVDDLNHFIGIITRKDIIKHFYKTRITNIKQD